MGWLALAMLNLPCCQFPPFFCLKFFQIVTLDPDDGHGLAIEWIILHVKNLRYKIVVKYGRKFQGQFVTDEMENNIKNSKFEPPFSTMPLKYMTVI